MRHLGGVYCTKVQCFFPAKMDERKLDSIVVSAGQVLVQLFQHAANFWISLLEFVETLRIERRFGRIVSLSRRVTITASEVRSSGPH